MKTFAAPSRRIARSRSAPQRSFTLVEMLVVVAVIVIVLAAVVPSVARIMRSTNYASAVNTVAATLGLARSRAMENGRPTAVAFLYDVQSRSYTLMPLEFAPSGDSGTLRQVDPPLETGLAPQNAAVYQPMRLTSSIELPTGMGVFGLTMAIPQRDDPQIANDQELEIVSGAERYYAWLAGEAINDGNGDPSDNIIPWIFPRNDPRLYVNTGVDPWRVLNQEQSGDMQRALTAVRSAMSFAVAFRPDGSTSTSFGFGVESTPLIDAFIEFPNRPLDDTAMEYDNMLAFDPGAPHPTNPQMARPNPEVRLRAVSQLAVVDMQSLQAGAGVNEPWFVRTDSSLAQMPSDFQDPKRRFIDTALVRRMSDWIDANAQVIGFNRYTGTTIKR